MNKLTYPSISENNGIAALSDADRLVYSVGISTGGVAEMRMAHANPKRQIVATTIDPNGLKFAQEHVESAGLLGQIDIKLEDVAKPLPYTDDHFDFIYARLVLHYLPRHTLEQTLQELYRVLKPSGRIFVVVRSTDCFEAKTPDAAYDQETRMTTYTSNGHTYSRYFHTQESIQNHLTSSGFRIQSTKAYPEQLCIDFQRTQLAQQLDSLIEVLATK